MTRTLLHFDPTDPEGVLIAAAAESIYAQAGYLNIRRVPILALVGDPPVIYTPPPAPALADWPLRKGMYVWQLPRSASGSPGRLVDMALAAGLEWLCFKVHDGATVYNGEIGPWVEACRQVHIDVWLWGYSYGNDPTGEARMAATRCLQYGARGYLIDAEGEYKGRPAQATTWVQTFKSLQPTVLLGLSSYRYPSLHTTFPFREFLSECDFHAPQVYWLKATSPTAPGAQLAKSIAQLKAIRDLPVVPIGCAFPFEGWRPSVAQLDNFHASALAQGCPGAGWWSWESAEADNEFWQTIFAHKWPR